MEFCSVSGVTGERGKGRQTDDTELSDTQRHHTSRDHWMPLTLCCSFKSVRHRKPSDIYLNVHDRSWVSGDVFRAIFLLLYIIGALWILMKKLWMWEYNIDVYGSNIILCSCMNDYKSLRLCIILHDWKQKYSPRPRQNTCFRSPVRSLIYLFFLDEYAWRSASVYLNNLLLIE